jgi:phosphate transport system permease protein
MSTSTIDAPASTAPAARKPPVRRRLHRHTFDDWMSLGGALLGSLCLVLIVFEHLVDGSGTLGFLVCWFATYLLMYGGLVALSNPRPVVTERLVTSTLWAAAGVVIFALGSTIVYTFAKGWNAYTHVGFFIHSMAGVAPTASLSHGGISHAIIGTVIEVGIAVIVAVPFGIGTAVYMSEVGGKFAKPVRTVVEAMTALPEILAGLFVYVVLVVDVGLPKSGLAASIAMAVTMVPIIARAAEVALRVVPAGLREASWALGAPQWRTVLKVVLPSARAGLATATILGVARGIGETAVVLITSGASTFVEVNPVKNPMNSLPLFIYTSYATHEPTAITRAFGAASVLLALVLVLFVATRLLSRDRKAKR